MKHKHLTSLLAVLMSMAASVASAHDFEVDGIYYNITSYSYMVAVTYQGSSYYSYSNRYTGSVTIPESVTYNSKTYYVTSIGERAFHNCSGLTSVTIPNSVTSIGYTAFTGCSALETIVVNSGNTVYDSREGCNAIVETASNTLVAGCKNTIIPNSVISIGDMAFWGCSGLTSVTIPNSVTSIGYTAFYWCSGLTSVTIPNSVTSIGGYAFYGCAGLTSITIPNSVTSIGGYAFSGCSGLTSVTIPNSVISIGESAFSSCTGLTSVTIGNSVIGESAFSGCSGLTSITIPNSVTSIGHGAFYNCNGLTSVTIPNSVTFIDKVAFMGCRIRNLMIKSPTPPSAGENTFSPQTYYHTTLYVPMDAWDAYAYDSNWYQFINIRETAMSEEEVNTDRAYTLMNAKTFTYAVYDPVNDDIGSIKSIGALDENNPNHSWQTLDVKGQKYLYNIGARRFAVPTSDGSSLRLLDNADGITMTDNEDGIVLNGHAETPWALVSNERMSIDKNAEENVTGLRAIDNEQLTIDNVYDLSGRQQKTKQKGINLLFMSDGATRKVLVK